MNRFDKAFFEAAANETISKLYPLAERAFERLFREPGVFKPSPSQEELIDMRAGAMDLVRMLDKFLESRGFIAGKVMTLAL